jgi:hypothetical protein
MPTLAKPRLIEPESPWGAPFDRMYLELCRNRIPILTALGFYAERDLSPPKNSDEILTKDEEDELRQIASALTEAAAVSATMPTAELVATLLKVSKQPSLFMARELPQPVELAIASNYQRCNEPPGTHCRDVWGDQAASFPGEVEQPTESSIAKAAAAALARIQKTRKAGRPYNQADHTLAIRLGSIFRQSGRAIRRWLVPTMREGKVVYVEGGGPVYDFLELVLKPLQSYLMARGLAEVTTATIVRRITDDFPKRPAKRDSPD